eukprot:g16621.t1
MLALVGVSAGLKASLAMSTCCVSLRDTLASPTLDKQLFGGLYAALAGVDNPSEAFLQPAWSSAPECPYPNNEVPIRLRTVGRASSPRKPASPLQMDAETQIPSVKRIRSLSNGSFPPEAATEGAAAIVNGVHIEHDTAYSPLVRDCWSYLRLETEGNLSAPAEAQQQRRNQRPGTVERQTWRLRLKEDMATGREPLKTFVFAGQSKGKQDVLLAVVPSTPPVIAITCTTELSLFSLDGTRLPVVAGSPQRWRRSVEDSNINSNTNGNTSTCRVEDSGDDDENEHHGEGVPQVPVEPHQRDIRCLAASPMGDMVATGSLDCTIRVRSVPGSDWVRRLRGHEAGLRCLAFHQTRLISADSLGMIAAWDVFPVSRRLCNVQGHSDSVQVLTLTSGGARLASGALDGSVVVWSISAEGMLAPLVTHAGLCHPYRLVAIGRCLAFTSSASTSMLTGLSDDVVNSDKKHGGSSCNGDGLHVALPVSKGAHISVVGVEPTSPTKRGPGRRRVSTGLARLQHLVAGRCLGIVMLSQTESWAEESDSSSDEEQGQDTFLGGGRVTYRPPRLCRIFSAELDRITSFEDFYATQLKSRSRPCCEGVGGGGRLEAVQAKWVKVSRCWSAVGQRPAMPPQPDVGITRGDSWGKCEDSNNSNSINNSNRNSNTDNTNGEDLDEGAFCTCAVFVGRTLFLGYDTGFIYAHRAYDGRRLYRLSMFGSVVHLAEAKGSLFAYASSGVVSRWSWGAE